MDNGAAHIGRKLDPFRTPKQNEEPVVSVAEHAPTPVRDDPSWIQQPRSSKDNSKIMETKAAVNPAPPTVKKRLGILAQLGAQNQGLEGAKTAREPQSNKGATATSGQKSATDPRQVKKDDQPGVIHDAISTEMANRSNPKTSAVLENRVNTYQASAAAKKGGGFTNERPGKIHRLKSAEID